jgi:hypothetical protein
LTSHVDDTVGRTWRVGAKRMGHHTLEVEEGAVQVSPPFYHRVGADSRRYALLHVETLVWPDHQPVKFECGICNLGKRGVHSV